MRYVYRILFMPAIIVCLLLLCIALIVHLLIYGKLLETNDYPILSDFIENITAPLIKRMS